MFFFSASAACMRMHAAKTVRDSPHAASFVAHFKFNFKRSLKKLNNYRYTVRYIYYTGSRRKRRRNKKEKMKMKKKMKKKKKKKKCRVRTTWDLSMAI